MQKCGCLCDSLCVFCVPQAKVDREILDYRNLAAIPKVKAIYDIERPDLINYEPLYTTSLDESEERESVGEVKISQTEALFQALVTSLSRQHYRSHAPDVKTGSVGSKIMPHSRQILQRHCIYALKFPSSDEIII